MTVTTPIYSMGGFGVFDAIFPLIFLVVIGVIVVTVVKGVSQWHTNNQSPRLTVGATVVSKRADTKVHHHDHGGVEPAGSFHTTTSTTYYATFQVESGDRMEFTVSGPEYGQLAEGDEGKLTFQGTRFLDFVRGTGEEHADG